MTVPLMLLAIAAVIGGFAFFAQPFLTLPHEGHVVVLVPALAVAALVAGAGTAFFVYRKRENEVIDVTVLRRKFYFDELYRGLIDLTQETAASFTAFIDRWLVDAGAVGGTAGGTRSLGALLRLVQVGNLQAYSFLFGIGVVLLIYFTVLR
jgi:NADH-quinone oxidoreductase subunit L